MKNFCKVFEDRTSQILVVLDDGYEPCIKVTIWIPDLGYMTSSFLCEETEEGAAHAREKFKAIDEKQARKIAKDLRKGFKEFIA